MRKSLTYSLIICVIALSLAGCAKQSVQKNEIKPEALTKEQEDIVYLLSDDKHEILLFDYKTEEPYKRVEFWVEVYENGVLAERPSGVNTFSDEAKPRNGQLAIAITQNPGFTWTFAVSESSSKISHTGEAANAEYDTTSRAYGSISEPVAIEDGKEIVLYTSIFANDDISSYDEQMYIEQPELIKKYPYFHIIKCKFTK